MPANRIHGFGKELAATSSPFSRHLRRKIVDASAMQEIATIPSMIVLRGKLLNLLNSPLQRIADGGGSARAKNEVIRKLK